MDLKTVSESECTKTARTNVMQVHISIRRDSSTHRAVEAEGDQHEEEDERPERRDRQCRDRFWVDNKHQSWTYMWTEHHSRVYRHVIIAITINKIL